MAGFEFGEAAFELPWLPSLLAPGEEGRASRRRLIGAGRVHCAIRNEADIGAMAVPQAGAGQEAKFEAVAHQFLEVGVGESVGLDGADMFVGEIDTLDAGVVRRQGHRHAEFAVEGEGAVSYTHLRAHETDY